MATPIRDKAWVDFRAWCVARGLKALPAHPWTVAAYVRFCGTRHAPKTITERLDIIGRVHMAKGHRAPDRAAMVGRTLDQLRRERRKGAKTGPALFRAEDFVAGAEAAPATETLAMPEAPPTPARPKKKAAKKGPLSQQPRLVSRRPRRSP